MKKRFMFVAMSAMLLTSVMYACTEKDQPYPGYEKTNSGLYYRFHIQNEGELPQNGDLLEVNLACTVNDTTFLFPAMENIMQLQESQFDGDLYEGLAMMHKGDSASFIVNIDSTFKKLMGRPTLPKDFTSTDVMRFDIRLNDFYPESEYAKHFAAKVKKFTDERSTKMKEEHPEETAIAAQQLAEYLAKNKIDVEPTPSGLYYVMTQEGNGEKPEVGQLVKVHYTGKLLNGEVFDSSADREPYPFPLGFGNVIPGWDEGIALMSKGEKGVLYIPYYLAYGERQTGDKIAPFSNLMFEVELVDFEDIRHE